MRTEKRAGNDARWANLEQWASDDGATDDQAREQLLREIESLFESDS